MSGLPSARPMSATMPFRSFAVTLVATSGRQSGKFAFECLPPKKRATESGPSLARHSGHRNAAAPRMIAADDNMGCGTFCAADLLLPARGPGVTLVGARQRRVALELEPDRCGGRHAGQDIDMEATATLRLGRGLDPAPGFGGWKRVHRGPPLERALLQAADRSSRGRERRLRRSLQCNSLASAEGVSRGRCVPISSAGLSRNGLSGRRCPKSAQGRLSCPSVGQVDNALG